MSDKATIAITSPSSCCSSAPRVPLVLSSKYPFLPLKLRRALIKVEKVMAAEEDSSSGVPSSSPSSSAMMAPAAAITAFNSLLSAANGYYGAADGIAQRHAWDVEAHTKRVQRLEERVVTMVERYHADDDSESDCDGDIMRIPEALSTAAALLYYAVKGVRMARMRQVIRGYEEGEHGEDEEEDWANPKTSENRWCRAWESVIKSWHDDIDSGGGEEEERGKGKEGPQQSDRPSPSSSEMESLRDALGGAMSAFDLNRKALKEALSFSSSSSSITIGTEEEGGNGVGEGHGEDSDGDVVGDAAITMRLLSPFMAPLDVDAPSGGPTGAQPCGVCEYFFPLYQRQRRVRMHAPMDAAETSCCGSHHHHPSSASLPPFSHQQTAAAATTTRVAAVPSKVSHCLSCSAADHREASRICAPCYHTLNAVNTVLTFIDDVLHKELVGRVGRGLISMALVNDEGGKDGDHRSSGADSCCHHSHLLATNDVSALAAAYRELDGCCDEAAKDSSVVTAHNGCNRRGHNTAYLAPPHPMADAHTNLTNRIIVETLNIIFAMMDKKKEMGHFVASEALSAIASDSSSSCSASASIDLLSRLSFIMATARSAFPHATHHLAPLGDAVVKEGATTDDVDDADVFASESSSAPDQAPPASITRRFVSLSPTAKAAAASATRDAVYLNRGPSERLTIERARWVFNGDFIYDEKRWRSRKGVDDGGADNEIMSFSAHNPTRPSLPLSTPTHIRISHAFRLFWDRPLIGIQVLDSPPSAASSSTKRMTSRQEVEACPYSSSSSFAPHSDYDTWIPSFRVEIKKSALQHVGRNEDEDDNELNASSRRINIRLTRQLPDLYGTSRVTAWKGRGGGHLLAFDFSVRGGVVDRCPFPLPPPLLSPLSSMSAPNVLPIRWVTFGRFYEKMVRPLRLALRGMQIVASKKGVQIESIDDIDSDGDDKKGDRNTVGSVSRQPHQQPTVFISTTDSVLWYAAEVATAMETVREEGEGAEESNDGSGRFYTMTGCYPHWRVREEMLRAIQLCRPAVVVVDIGVLERIVKEAILMDKIRNERQDGNEKEETAGDKHNSVVPCVGAGVSAVDDDVRDCYPRLREHLSSLHLTNILVLTASQEEANSVIHTSEAYRMVKDIFCFTAAESQSSQTQNGSGQFSIQCVALELFSALQENTPRVDGAEKGSNDGDKERGRHHCNPAVSQEAHDRQSDLCHHFPNRFRHAFERTLFRTIPPTNPVTEERKRSEVEQRNKSEEKKKEEVDEFDDFNHDLIRQVAVINIMERKQLRGADKRQHQNQDEERNRVTIDGTRDVASNPPLYSLSAPHPIASIIFTSGTSGGAPKGTILDQRAWFFDMFGTAAANADKKDAAIPTTRSNHKTEKRGEGEEEENPPATTIVYNRADRHGVALCSHAPCWATDKLEFWSVFMNGGMAGFDGHCIPLTLDAVNASTTCCVNDVKGRKTPTEAMKKGDTGFVDSSSVQQPTTEIMPLPTNSPSNTNNDKSAVNDVFVTFATFRPGPHLACVPIFGHHIRDEYFRLRDWFTKQEEEEGGSEDGMWDPAHSKGSGRTNAAAPPPPPPAAVVIRARATAKAAFVLFRYFLGGRIEGIGLGGAAVPPDLQHFLRFLLPTRCRNSYGSTECGGLLSSGKPLPGVIIKLFDRPELGFSSRDVPFPRGEIGVRVDGNDSLVKSEAWLCDDGTKSDVGKRYVYAGEQHVNDIEIGGDAALTSPHNTMDVGSNTNGECFLLTGDIAMQVAENTFVIIDRASSVQKLANGKFFSPEVIEEAVRQYFLSLASSSTSSSKAQSQGDGKDGENKRGKKITTRSAFFGAVLESLLVAPSIDKTHTVILLRFAEREANQTPATATTPPINISRQQLLQHVVKACQFTSVDRSGVGGGIPADIIPCQAFIDRLSSPWTAENGCLTPSHKLNRNVIVRDRLMPLILGEGEREERGVGRGEDSPNTLVDETASSESGSGEDDDDDAEGEKKGGIVKDVADSQTQQRSAENLKRKEKPKTAKSLSVDELCVVIDTMLSNTHSNPSLERNGDLPIVSQAPRPPPSQTPTASLQLLVPLLRLHVAHWFLHELLPQHFPSRMTAWDLNKVDQNHSRVPTLNDDDDDKRSPFAYLTEVPLSSLGCDSITLSRARAVLSSMGSVLQRAVTKRRSRHQPLSASPHAPSFTFSFPPSFFSSFTVPMLIQSTAVAVSTLLLQPILLEENFLQRGGVKALRQQRKSDDDDDDDQNAGATNNPHFSDTIKEKEETVVRAENQTNLREEDEKLPLPTASQPVTNVPETTTRPSIPSPSSPPPTASPAPPPAVALRGVWESLEQRVITFLEEGISRANARLALHHKGKEKEAMASALETGATTIDENKKEKSPMPLELGHAAVVREKSHSARCAGGERKVTIITGATGFLGITILKKVLTEIGEEEEEEHGVIENTAMGLLSDRRIVCLVRSEGNMNVYPAPLPHAIELGNKETGAHQLNHNGDGSLLRLRRIFGKSLMLSDPPAIIDSVQTEDDGWTIRRHSRTPFENKETREADDAVFKLLSLFDRCVTVVPIIDMGREYFGFEEAQSASSSTPSALEGATNKNFEAFNNAYHEAIVRPILMNLLRADHHGDHSCCDGMDWCPEDNDGIESTTHVTIINCAAAVKHWGLSEEAVKVIGPCNSIGVANCVVLALDLSTFFAETISTPSQQLSIALVHVSTEGCSKPQMTYASLPMQWLSSYSDAVLGRHITDSYSATKLLGEMALCHVAERLATAKRFKSCFDPQSSLSHPNMLKKFLFHSSAPSPTDLHQNTSSQSQLSASPPASDLLFLSFAIIRSPMLTWDSGNGYGNGEDWINRLLQSCLMLGRWKKTSSEKRGHASVCNADKDNRCAHFFSPLIPLMPPQMSHCGPIVFAPVDHFAILLLRARDELLTSRAMMSRGIIKEAGTGDSSTSTIQLRPPPKPSETIFSRHPVIGQDKVRDEYESEADLNHNDDFNDAAERGFVDEHQQDVSPPHTDSTSIQGPHAPLLLWKTTRFTTAGADLIGFSSPQQQRQKLATLEREERAEKRRQVEQRKQENHAAEEEQNNAQNSHGMREEEEEEEEEEGVGNGISSKFACPLLRCDIPPAFQRPPILYLSKVLERLANVSAFCCCGGGDGEGGGGCGRVGEATTAVIVSPHAFAYALASLTHSHPTPYHPTAAAGEGSGGFAIPPAPSPTALIMPIAATKTTTEKTPNSQSRGNDDDEDGHHYDDDNNISNTSLHPLLTREERLHFDALATALTSTDGLIPHSLAFPHYMGNLFTSEPSSLEICGGGGGGGNNNYLDHAHAAAAVRCPFLGAFHEGGAETQSRTLWEGPLKKWVQSQFRTRFVNGNSQQ